jgi:UDP-N-acetylmuramoyl-tripeptide--D-alanyl-D-alanine ligase
MKLTVGELKKLFPNHTVGLPDATAVAGVSQDTRKIRSGELYVAIAGDNFDGHDFVDQAFSKGAVAALVDESRVASPNCFRAKDTVEALGRLANFYRRKFPQPLVAITGSNGKTTNKELLAHVLALSGKVVATEGNLNNHIGVPLTISRFCEDARYFVVEMGMNRPGEIRYLARIAEPTVGYVTSVGRAHMEGVGGAVDGVAKAKGELFEELSHSALAVVNADDPHIARMPTKARRMTFGFTAGADVRAENVGFFRDHAAFTVIHHGHKTDVKLNLAGHHHVRNALAVFAIAESLGMDRETIKRGLESFRIGFNRGQTLHKGRFFFVDDTYNANPDSMAAAFESFALQFPHAHRIAVLGGMLELGPDAKRLHGEVGMTAKTAGFDGVFAFGAGAGAILSGFGYAPEVVAKRGFTDHDAMGTAVIDAARAIPGEVALLFKGSRGMKMEKVLEKVLEKV